MLVLLTVLIMAAVAYVYLNEGLSTAFVMCCNVLFAGLVAFNFWEPLADVLAPNFRDTFLEGFEDAIGLVFLFCLTLGLLRFATNSIAPLRIEFHPAVQNIGGAIFGLISGYLVSGFLVCVFQTLPWNVNFAYFESKYVAGQGLRDILPPDRIWLAMMHRAGAFTFANNVDPLAPDTGSPYDHYLTFDKDGSFELRYARYRRYGFNGKPIPYHGEFDHELRRSP